MSLPGRGSRCGHRGKRTLRPGSRQGLDVARCLLLSRPLRDIHYRIRTPLDGMPTGPVTLAGPTCDSTDVLYERAAYDLPLDLSIGDYVDFLSAGAYTASYASVEFNGFSPIQTRCI